MKVGNNSLTALLKILSEGADVAWIERYFLRAKQDEENYLHLAFPPFKSIWVTPLMWNIPFPLHLISELSLIRYFSIIVWSGRK